MTTDDSVEIPYPAEQHDPVTSRSNVGSAALTIRDLKTDGETC